MESLSGQTASPLQGNGTSRPGFDCWARWRRGGRSLLDPDRLDAVRRAGMTPQELLDGIVAGVRVALQVRSALVTLIDANHQYLQGAVGLNEPWLSMREVPMSHSLCRLVVINRRPLIVGDARRDARVSDNPAVEELSVAAYAGWPLITHEGLVLGSLCGFDTTPREWTERELEYLRLTAATVIGVIEAQTRVTAARRAAAGLQDLAVHAGIDQQGVDLHWSAKGRELVGDRR